MTDTLKPCPFCGAGETTIAPNGRIWMGMKWSEPSSVSVQHHCPPEPGQPSRMLERVGRDEESAIAAWNRRTQPAGMVLVPVEATDAMSRAAVVYANGNAVYKNVAAEALKIEESIYGEVWAAMLAAAQQGQREGGNG